MPSHVHTQYFDINFSFGDESVFTLKTDNENIPEPPVEGYFLWLDDTPFYLLDGEKLTLL
jgi:hypothetical protein